jgi:hypothetical protein
VYWESEVIMKQSEALAEAAVGIDPDELCNRADSCCTAGYNNDDSTGFEIFENGFELGQAAKDKKANVFYFELDGAVYFVIAKTEKEAVARFKKPLDED